MAKRPNYIVGDKASPLSTVRGNTLSAEFCTQAFPESYNKRQFFRGATLAPTQDNAFNELFIDGVENFRFRVPEVGVSVIKLLAAYHSAGATTAFEITIAMQNLSGTVTFLGTPLIVKYPSASTVNINVQVAADQLSCLQLMAQGIAGNTNGRWDFQCDGVSEITDIG